MPEYSTNMSSTIYYTTYNDVTSTTGLSYYNVSPISMEKSNKEEDEDGIINGCYCPACEKARQQKMQNKKSKNGNKLAILF